MGKIIVCLVSLLATATFSFKGAVFSDSPAGFTVYVGADGSSGRAVAVEGVFEALSYLTVGVYGCSVKGVDRGYVEKKLKDLDAVYLFAESAEAVVTKYYYSAHIPFYKTINGKKVNLQTAEVGLKYVVGSPLIYGGY